RPLSETALPDILYELLRYFAAGVGGLLAWFVVAPLACGLVRLAFQRKLPDGGVVASRFLGAIGTAVLIYVLFPHFGGGGRGKDGGTGDDVGPGIAGNTGTGKPGGDRPGPSKTGGPSGGNAELPKDGLPVQILGGTRKDGRFYFVQGKEMNWDELDAFLTDHKGEWRKVDIILTADSPSEIEGTAR